MAETPFGNPNMGALFPNAPSSSSSSSQPASTQNSTTEGPAVPSSADTTGTVASMNVGMGAPGSIISANGALGNTGANVNSTPSSGAISQAYLQAIAQYPQYAWMLNDPTLMVKNPQTGQMQNILQVAAQNNWDQATLDAALTSTKWFQQNSDTMRNYQQLQNQDPAQYHQDVAGQAAIIALTAQQWGVNLTPQQVGAMAGQALSLGWNQQQINQAIASHAQFTQGLQSAGAASYTGAGTVPNGGGQLGGIMDQYMQIAKQNLIPLSPQSAYQWAVNTLAGSTNQASYNAYIQAQAKSLFPQFSNQIDQGISVGTLAQPYQQAAASVLGMDPNQINMTDPKFLVGLTGNGATGHKAMSLDQWNTYLMANPAFGFANTTNGKAQASNLANFIGTAMGADAGSPASTSPEFARTA